MFTATPIDTIHFKSRYNTAGRNTRYESRLHKEKKIKKGENP